MNQILDGLLGIIHERYNNMAMRRTTSTPPTATRAARFFTMVNMDQGDNARGVNQDYITDLVVPALRPGDGSRFLPDNPGSAYAPGAIIAAVMGPQAQSQPDWAQPPMTNNAITNQAAFFSAVGSIVMSFNLAENLENLQRDMQSSSPETITRDPILMTKELEQAICSSVVKSSTAEEFVESVQGQYQSIFLSTRILTNIYNDLQFLPGVMTDGEIPSTDQLVDWEMIANATAPVPGPQIGARADMDPILATNIVARNVPVSPGIILFEETSPHIQGAILVNNLVATPGPTVDAINSVMNLAAQANAGSGDPYR